MIRTERVRGCIACWKVFGAWRMMFGSESVRDRADFRMHLVMYLFTLDTIDKNH